MADTLESPQRTTFRNVVRGMSTAIRTQPSVEMQMSLLRNALRPVHNALSALDARIAGSPAKAKPRWLLVFNCANIGLANCLKLQAPGIEVESIDFGRFSAGFPAWEPRLGEFDLIITSPHFLRNDSVDFTRHARTRTLPIIQFDAYHPDLCYVIEGGKVAKGPMGDYHSQIVTAAHAKGLPESAARELFTAERFAAFGFFSRWDAARQRLLAGFEAAGIPMDACYPGWSARGPFMHSVNHPAISVLHDVASGLLQAEGLEPVRGTPLPYDNLLNGAVYPIYEEIAEALSVRGSYVFKLPAQYRCIGLDEFIAESYAALGACEARPEVHRAYRISYERVLANL